jgi:RNA polymerase sigma factor (sigma-70 family)
MNEVPLVALYETYHEVTGAWLENTARKSGLADGLSRDDFDDLLCEARDVAVARAARRKPDQAAEFMGIVALNHLRRQRRVAPRRAARNLLASAVRVATAAASDADPVKAFAEREVSLALGEAIGQLSPDERDVIALVYEEHILLRDAAAQLGIPASTASDRHVRGLRKVRAVMLSLAEVDPLLGYAIQELYGDGALATLSNCDGRAARGGA